MTEVTLRNYLEGHVSVQDMADFVITKLMGQGKGSVGSFNTYEEDGKTHFEEVRCAYRAPDGSKCAVGWLIPDDEYVNEMDHPEKKANYTLGVIDLIDKFYAEDKIKSNLNHRRVLGGFQSVHDRAAMEALDGEDFKKNLLKRAYRLYNEYCLDTTLLDSYSVVV